MATIFVNGATDIGKKLGRMDLVLSRHILEIMNLSTFVSSPDSVWSQSWDRKIRETSTERDS
jgi:hypothetical protein